MNIKKKLLAIPCATLAVASIMSITALAATYYGNPKTYSKTVSGTFMVAGIYPGWTSTQPTSYGVNEGYDDSLKKSVYKEYEIDGGIYEILFSDTESDTYYNVTTDLSHNVDNSAVKREHKSYLYYSSNVGSGVIEYRPSEVIKQTP